MGELNGILGRKLGMTQIFRDNGIAVPVTAIEAGPCIVTQVKTRAKEGYSALQVGFGPAKRVSKPEAGHLRASGAANLRHLQELRLEADPETAVGHQYDAGIFAAGDYVDVVGTSKGKGFAGVVKRHHFAGGPKTHGQSDRHRAPGSMGSTTTPGRTWKGQRMGGQMGNVRVTVQHLEVVKVEPERNLLWLRGAVPGATKALVLVKRAVKS